MIDLQHHTPALADVISNANPRTTFMELLGWDKLSLFRKERLSTWLKRDSGSSQP